MIISETLHLWLAAIAAIFAALALGDWLRRRRLRQKRREGREKRERDYDKASEDYERVRDDLERKFNATVVDLVDDLGDVSRGRDDAPLWINYETAMKVLSRIRDADDGPIVVVLHTLGGYSFAAEMIAAALHSHKGRVEAYVPFVAMSGGTIISLACHTVFMGKHAALGPIDAQLGGVALDDFARLVAEKPITSIGDGTLLAAYAAERYRRNADERACQIIHKSHKPDGDGDCRVVMALMKSQLPHDTRIDFKHAKRIGMHVEEKCPEEVYALVEARLQMIEASERRPRKSEPPRNDSK
jgi:ClpP class serine protease